jgi:GNAT superfamily N-acetyltransferase
MRGAPGGRPPGQRGMIRAARAEDVPAIHRLIRELARYEHSVEQVTGTEEDLRRSLFGTDPAVYAHVAVSEGGAAGDKDANKGGGEGEGAVVGMALWFLNYSTWTGQHGIYLEDLFVEPGVRGRGYGKALLAELAGICVERGYARLDWAVLDWNTPSIEFYQSIGARAMDEWDIYRLTGPALTALGSARSV